VLAQSHSLSLGFGLMGQHKKVALIAQRRQKARAGKFFPKRQRKTLMSLQGFLLSVEVFDLNTQFAARAFR
jgi:hypothetical protein